MLQMNEEEKIGAFCKAVTMSEHQIRAFCKAVALIRGVSGGDQQGHSRLTALLSNLAKQCLTLGQTKTTVFRVFCQQKEKTEQKERAIICKKYDCRIERYKKLYNRLQQKKAKYTAKFTELSSQGLLDSQEILAALQETLLDLQEALLGEYRSLNELANKTLSITSVTNCFFEPDGEFVENRWLISLNNSIWFETIDDTMICTRTLSDFSSPDLVSLHGQVAKILEEASKQDLDLTVTEQFVNFTPDRLLEFLELLLTDQFLIRIGNGSQFGVGGRNFLGQISGLVTAHLTDEIEKGSVYQDVIQKIDQYSNKLLANKEKKLPEEQRGFFLASLFRSTSSNTNSQLTRQQMHALEKELVDFLATNNIEVLERLRVDGLLSFYSDAIMLQGYIKRIATFFMELERKKQVHFEESQETSKDVQAFPSSKPKPPLVKNTSTLFLKDAAQCQVQEGRELSYLDLAPSSPRRGTDSPRRTVDSPRCDKGSPRRTADSPRTLQSPRAIAIGGIEEEIDRYFRVLITRAIKIDKVHLDIIIKQALELYPNHSSELLKRLQRLKIIEDAILKATTVISVSSPNITSTSTTTKPVIKPLQLTRTSSISSILDIAIQALELQHFSLAACKLDFDLPSPPVESSTTTTSSQTSAIKAKFGWGGGVGT